MQERKVKIDSKDELVKSIRQLKADFIAKYKETPLFVLLDKKDFLKASAWRAEHSTERIDGMKPMLDNTISRPIVGGI